MFILASTSIRRQAILTKLGLEFKVVPPHVVENISVALSPVKTACAIAQKKAEAVASSFPDKFTVAADTIIDFEGKIIGKPVSIKDAEKLLLGFSGKEHKVITAVCIMHPSKHKKLIFSDKSSVKFKKLNVNIVRKYLSLINPLDKAGAYAIQEYPDLIIESFTGSLDNIIGFPTEKFKKNLKDLLLTSD